ncbi:MAG: rod shape-determining protein RodA [Thermaerobacter sp.]|nr:rod shape-determining protein RodA [Thermaerobacter sp.]
MARLLRVDFGLLLVVAVLCVASLMVIGSATHADVPGSPLYYVQHQIQWLVLGTLLLIVTATINYRDVRSYAAYIYAFGVILLTVVLVAGHSALGAQRWIQLGPFQLQPSEFAKLALVVGLADLLAQRKRLDRMRDLWGPILFAAIPAALVFKQPDLGTALIFVAILVVMLFMAGARIWHLLLLFGGGFGLVVLWVYLHLNFHVPLPFIHAYQLKRLLVFLNPNVDPTGSGYNIIQSLVSIGSGGMTGLGLHSNQAILTFLPEHATDFIFAVVALDFGFAGGAVLLALYLVLVWRSLNVVSEVRDPFGALLGAGIVTMLAVQVLMNAGMAMGVMPVVGVPLPFLSYGGSSILTDFLGIGVLLSLRLHPGKLTFRS